MSGENTERQQKINELFVDTFGKGFLRYMKELKFKPSDNQLMMIIRDLRTDFFDEAQERELTISKHEISLAITNFVFNHIDDPSDRVELEKMINVVGKLIKKTVPNKAITDFIDEFHKAFKSFSSSKEGQKKKLAEERQQKINTLFVAPGNTFLDEMRKVDFKPSDNQFETAIQNLIENFFKNKEIGKQVNKLGLESLGGDEVVPTFINFISHHVRNEEQIKLGVAIYSGALGIGEIDYYHGTFQAAFSAAEVSQDNKENIEKELLKNVKEFFSPSAIEAYCYFCIDNKIAPSDTFGQDLLNIFQDENNNNKLKSVEDVYIKAGKQESVAVYTFKIAVDLLNDIFSKNPDPFGITKAANYKKVRNISTENIVNYLSSLAAADQKK